MRNSSRTFTIYTRASNYHPWILYGQHFWENYVAGELANIFKPTKKKNIQVKIVETTQETIKRRNLAYRAGQLLAEALR